MSYTTTIIAVLSLCIFTVFYLHCTRSDPESLVNNEVVMFDNLTMDLDTVTEINNIFIYLDSNTYLKITIDDLAKMNEQELIKLGSLFGLAYLGILQSNISNKERINKMTRIMYTLTPNWIPIQEKEQTNAESEHPTKSSIPGGN